MSKLVRWSSEQKSESEKEPEVHRCWAGEIMAQLNSGSFPVWKSIKWGGKIHQEWREWGLHIHLHCPPWLPRGPNANVGPSAFSSQLSPRQPNWVFTLSVGPTSCLSGFPYVIFQNASPLWNSFTRLIFWVTWIVQVPRRNWRSSFNLAAILPTSSPIETPFLCSRTLALRDSWWLGRGHLTNLGATDLDNSFPWALTAIAWTWELTSAS